MSHLRSTPIALATLITGALLSSPAAAVDWTCDPGEVTYCHNEERDNVTIYIDTDGSMNSLSDDDIPGDGDWQDDTYWEWAQYAVADFAADQQNAGSCDDCWDEDCDEMRVGLGYFSDNSIDNSGDTYNAYRAVSAGEDRASAIATSLAGEAVGTVGLPGIETLTCPVDGTGQTATFTCPPNGTAQIERVICPANGSPQTDTITCPPNGGAQVTRVRCPRDGRRQSWSVRVTGTSPFNPNYAVTVDGITVNHMWNLAETTSDIAQALYDNAVGNASLTDDIDVALNYATATVTFQAKSSAYPAFATSFTGFLTPVGAVSPIPGVPDSPAVGEDVRLRISGEHAGNYPDITYAVDATDTSTSVCTELATLVTAQNNDVSATVIPDAVNGDILQLTSTVPGRSFSVGNFAFMSLIGTTTANLPGLPDDPSETQEYRLRIDMTPGPRATLTTLGNAPFDQVAVCEAIRDEINAGPKPVTAVFNGTNTLTITADVVGKSFTIDQVSPTGTNGLAHFSMPGTAGLPGTPEPGTNYTISLDSGLGPASAISVTGADDTTSATLCGALKTAVDNAASTDGHPVTTSALGTTLDGKSYFDIIANPAGAPFTVTVSASLQKTVISAGTVGLPGTPGPNFIYDTLGPNYAYDFDYEDVFGNVSTISVPSDATPTSAEVCANLAAAIDAHPHFVASVVGSQVLVTPQIQGLTWTFTNTAPLGYTTSIGANLPNMPGPLTDYGLTINGTSVAFVDDGSPTQAEICTGLAAAIDAHPAVTACAYPDNSCEIPTTPGTIVIRGSSPAVFNIEDFHPSMTKTVVRVAGLGPTAYGDLANRISTDLGINDRRQHAIVVTRRPPLTFADFDAARAKLCEKRDATDLSATTHFVGFDLSGRDKELLDVLAAAGGSGSCGTDPCVTSPVTALNFATFNANVCDGARITDGDSLKDTLDSITSRFSCTFDLSIPASYTNGLAPTNLSAVSVKIGAWALADFDSEPAQLFPAAWVNDNYDNYLQDNHDVDFAWGERSQYEDEGWYYPNGDRSKITFTGTICRDIRNGRLGELTVQVGCLCSNQGQECVANTDADGDGMPDLFCKSLISGEPDGPCSIEQLAKMRCATGVYVCTDEGDEICTADPSNVMPEICNGIDDDCDGIVDNMSNSTEAQFDGEDPQGKHCNFQNTCSCPTECTDDGMGNTVCLPYGGDVPSLSTDVADHLASWSGACTCGDGLEADYSETPADDEDPAMLVDDNAACSTGLAAGGAGNAALFLGLFGFLAIWRRRRS